MKALSCAAKVGNVVDTNFFVNQTSSITEVGDFDVTYDNATTDFEVFHYNSPLDDPNIKYYKDNANYQIYEPLVGWIDTTGDGSKK